MVYSSCSGGRANGTGEPLVDTFDLDMAMANVTGSEPTQLYATKGLYKNVRGRKDYIRKLGDRRIENDRARKVTMGRRKADQLERQAKAHAKMPKNNSFDDNALRHSLGASHLENAREVEGFPSNIPGREIGPGSNPRFNRFNDLFRLQDMESYTAKQLTNVMSKMPQPSSNHYYRDYTPATSIRYGYTPKASV
jgi:hypothetical protein